MEKELTNPAFDYSQVSEDDAGKLNYFEGQLIASRKRVAQEVISHGEILHGVQQLLADYSSGVFVAWLASVGIGTSSAYNAIDAFVEFGSLENLEVSAMYALAKNERAKKRAMKLADRGTKVTHKMAKTLIDNYKAEPPSEPIEAEPPALEPDTEPADCVEPPRNPTPPKQYDRGHWLRQYEHTI
mgnify:CR=1 FL=1